MDEITVWQGDCLERMREIPDGSVSLIAVDPPYYRVKDDEEWDRQWPTPAAFLAWIGELCGEWRRVLAPNGSLYVFASPAMAWGVEGEIRKRFDVLNRISWRKDDGWSKRQCKEDLRAFFPASEAIIFAEQNLIRTVEYLRSQCDLSGLTPAQLSGLLGFKETNGSIAPRRYLSESGFAPISRENYARLQERTGQFSLLYDDLYRPFNVDASVPYTDVWDFPTVPTYPGKHPCEKPLALFEHIVSASSRPGDLVLDCFAGSGVTGRACRNLGRRCILIEKDPHWAHAARVWLDRPHAYIPRGKKIKEMPLFQGFGVDH